MEPTRLKALESEVRAQWAAIEDVYQAVEVRSARLQLGDPISLESLAYQLHNLYSAMENLFRLVAEAFENSVAEAGSWHMELLRRMKIEIEGVRPALVSKELYLLLNELRGFRHFFRHAYEALLDEERVRHVLQWARQSRPLLQRDLDHFLQQLGASLQ